MSTCTTPVVDQGQTIGHAEGAAPRAKANSSVCIQRHRRSNIELAAIDNQRVRYRRGGRGAQVIIGGNGERAVEDRGAAAVGVCSRQRRVAARAVGSDGRIRFRFLDDRFVSPWQSSVLAEHRLMAISP